MVTSDRLSQSHKVFSWSVCSIPVNKDLFKKTLLLSIRRSLMLLECSNKMGLGHLVLSVSLLITFELISCFHSNYSDRAHQSINSLKIGN